MKKILSVFLAVIMAFSCLSVCASAVGKGGVKAETPMIFLHGKVGDIIDSEGNVVYDFDYDTSNLWNDVVEVCKDTLLKGIVTGDFTDYYNAIYKKISQIYDGAQYDNDGNPKYGSYAKGENRNSNLSSKNNVDHNGEYKVEGYDFWYDWRNDPYAVIDKLDEYIDNVIKATGKPKVSLIGRCLGGAFITAYIEKYGTSKIQSVVYDEVTLMGGEMVSDIFSGKINLSAAAITRFVEGDMADTLEDAIGADLFSFLSSTLNLLNALGATGVITNAAIEKVYNTIGKGVASAFVRASFATWPAFWTIVKGDDYETAKNFVFGKEGSQTRQDFAGLIEKTDNFYNRVKVNFSDILLEAKENGVNFGVVAKYGVQAYPYVNNPDALSDSFVSLPNSTFGATVVDIGKKLPASYLEKADAKYISLDKMVDTSTCLFPDSTWIIKGNSHDDYTPYEDEVIRRVCSSKEQVTVFDFEDMPQFASYVKDKDDCEPMTEENMNCEPYAGVNTNPGEGGTKVESILRKVATLVDFLVKFFKMVVSLLAKAE